MPHVLSAIENISQYLSILDLSPLLCKPPACVHCGGRTLWGHGCYFRKPRPNSTDLNLVPILRFYCPLCHRTCATLPGCLSPRRWYLWCTQELALMAVLMGVCYERAAEQAEISPHTVGRWWCWLMRRREQYALVIRSHFPSLGRTADPPAFWRRCLDQFSLAKVMALLILEGISVP